jgi:hypothetical protein
MMKRHRVALAAIAAIAVVSWFGFREYRCKLRGAVFARQVENIQRDAAKELKVGANKTEMARFFAEHNIPFSMQESKAFGSLRTSGCAPFGCGTNVAFILVVVNLDETGTVAEAPRVNGMYKDCF